MSAQSSRMPVISRADRVGAGDVADVGAGILLHADREHRPHAVDQAVGGGRHDDVAPQLVSLDLAREAPLHRPGK